MSSLPVKTVNIISPHAIAHGDIMCGFDIIGPFSNYQEAQRFAQSHAWTNHIQIIRLVSPAGLEKSNK